MIFDGLKQLITSPSGFFALLSLLAVSYVTLKQPSVGGVAFAAFFPVAVAILTWTEHKEQAQMNEINNNISPTASTTTTVVKTVEKDVADISRGQL